MKYRSPLEAPVIGRVTNDGNLVYLYDAEGRIVAGHPVGNTSVEVGYIYDAEGRRVAKGTVSSMGNDPTTNGFSPTNVYILGLKGEQVTELTGSTLAWNHTNAYASGELLATITSNGSTSQSGWDTQFVLHDWLGTKRVELGASGCAQTWVQYPYGDGLVSNGTLMAGQQLPTCSVDATEHHFTGKERDSESGLDYFGARYYQSSMGRWMSPDWSEKPEPVPYAHFYDPQSLNLYGFLLSNPLRDIDSDGHCCLNSLKQWIVDHPRTVQVAKGVGELAVGVTAVGVAATAEVETGGVATIGVIFAVQGGVASAVKGISDITAGATKTNVSDGSKALDAVSNPAGQIVTAMTGNIDKGAIASAVGNAAVTAATIKDVTEGSSALRTTIRTALAINDGKEAVSAVMDAVKQSNPNPNKDTQVLNEQGIVAGTH